MNPYETLIVLHADLGETGTREMVQRIRSILEADKAVIRSIDEWGIRELAYAIRKQHRGYYVLVQYAALPKTVTELERQLRLADQAIRFLTVRQIQRRQLPPRKPRPDAAGGEEEAGEETA
ncbi:MAG: 30S ribosomal protein S6 [Candidatus Binatia bacterium]